jgi:hypothetical protein
MLAALLRVDPGFARAERNATPEDPTIGFRMLDEERAD